MKLVKLEKLNCTPCRMMDSFLEELDVKVDQKITLNKHPEVAMKLGIMQVPVLILLNEDIDVLTATADEIESAKVDMITGQGRSKILGILEKAEKLN